MYIKMKFKSDKSSEEQMVTKTETEMIKEAIIIQWNLVKTALDSAEKSLNSLFDLLNEDNG